MYICIHTLKDWSDKSQPHFIQHNLKATRPGEALLEAHLIQIPFDYEYLGTRDSNNWLVESYAQPLVTFR